MSWPTLTTEQENVIRLVLERNHTYYVAQGMSRPHMWPEELLSEIRNELTHASKDQLKTKQASKADGEKKQSWRPPNWALLLAVFIGFGGGEVMYRYWTGPTLVEPYLLRTSNTIEAPIS